MSFLDVLSRVSDEDIAKTLDVVTDDEILSTLSKAVLDIDDALIEGLSQNQDFFSMLLSNDEMKRQVLGIFSNEIYKSLRNAK